jgi:hypothetical protein
MKSPHVVIPVVVFVVTLVVGLALTILVAYVWDGSEPVGPPAGVKALPPFPSVSPLVAPPPVNPEAAVCVSLVGDETGAYVPSPLFPLRACSLDADCADCHVAPEDLDATLRRTLRCVNTGDASAGYPDVASTQAALGFSGSQFCLPQKHACLPPESDSLVACTHDSECAQCNDEIGDGAAMSCQIVSRKKLLSRGDADAEDVIEVQPGRWCLPRTGACDAENGVLQWTTEGWSCNCRYPDIHTGEACDVVKACNNFLTTPWSAAHQQLVVNEASSGPDPEAWSMSTGVNPMLCHVGGVTDRGAWDQVCDPANANLVPNAVCQCDGLMLGSYMGFRAETENPLTCTPDSCSVNALGGRASEPLALVEWSSDPDVPANQCVCSGANSRLWDSDPSSESGREQEGFVFRGRCADVTLPQSEVVIRADPERMASDVCATASNSAAEVTSLVPGYAQDATGSASVSVCSADPCRGTYSDPEIAPPENVRSWGHYDATVGACSCVSPAATVAVAECNNTLNPVCSTCVNACAGMESSNEEDWPCGTHATRPCSTKSTCLTDAQGNAMCTCGEECAVADDGTCAAKFAEGEGCKGFVGVPNICSTGSCKCHAGQGTSGGSGGLGFNFSVSCEDKDTYHAMCTTSESAVPTCRVGESGVFVSCGSTPCPAEAGCDRFSS